MHHARCSARFALALFVMLLARAAQAECPPSTFLYGGIDPAIPIVKVAARCDTTFSTQICDRVHGRYDVPAGLLIASIDVACADAFGTGPTGLETIVEDDFDILGLAPGTPVSFEAKLQVVGEGHSFSEPFGPGGARARGTLQLNASPWVERVWATTGVDPAFFANEVIALPVSGVAGTPIHLRFAVRAEAYDGRGSLEGRFFFTGLPAGVLVRSCRGYDSGAPTAVRATTWGRLKARYR